MNINDEIKRATGGPTVNEGLSTWFSRTALETLQDAERRWLFALAAVTKMQATADMWYVYLRSLGHTGSLNDMKLAYWTAQATTMFYLVTAAGDNLTDDVGNLLTL